MRRFTMRGGLCVLDFLFTGGRPLPCLEAADSNNDGGIDCSDAIFTLGYLFLGSGSPADPGPPHLGRPCGSDPDLLGAPGYLGCEGYPHCGPEG